MKQNRMWAVCAACVTAFAVQAPAWTFERFVTSNSGDGTIEGDTAFSSSTATVQEDGTTTVKMMTRGNDIWSSSDSGGFCFESVGGDAEVSATVQGFLQEGDNASIGQYAKAGVMMRQTSLAAAPHVFLYRETVRTSVTDNVTNYTSRICFSYRSTRGGTTTGINYNLTENAQEDVKLRLVRQGDTFTGYYALPGQNGWTQYGTVTLALPNDVNAGFAATPQSSSATLTVTADSLYTEELVEAVADSGTSSVALSWDAPAVEAGESVTGYTIARSVYGTTAETVLASDVAETSYTDSTLDAANRYVYTVTATVASTDDEAVLDGNEYTTRTVTVGTSRDTVIPLETANSNEHGLGSEGKTGAHHSIKSAAGEQLASYVWWSSEYNPFPVNGSNPDRVYPADAELGFDSSSEQDNFTIDGQTVFRSSKTGYHTIRFNADDGVILRVNGELIINQPDYIGRSGWSAPFYAEAGRDNFISFHFIENSGGQSLDLRVFDPDGTQHSYIAAGSSYRPVPEPWTFSDIGKAPKLGSVLYDESTRNFTMGSTGTGWAGAADVGQYACLDTPSGDYDFIARVTLPGEGSQVGLVMRENAFDPSTAQVAFLLQNGTASVVTRSAAGADPVVVSSQDLATIGATDGTAFLRISSESGKLRFSLTDGSVAYGTWTTVAEGVTPPAGLACLGIAGASGSNLTLYTNTVDAVSLLDRGAELEMSVAKTGTDRAVVSVVETSEAVDRAAMIESMRGYWWANYTTTYAAAFDVYMLSGVPFDQLTDDSATWGTQIAYGAAPGAETVWVPPSTDDRELMYFTFVCTDNTLNDTDAAYTVHSIGTAFAEPTEAGTGLLFNYYSTWRGGPEGDPTCTEIGGIVDYDRTQGVLKSPGGTSLGGQNFFVNYSGYITPPYTAYYRFITPMDDYLLLTVDDTSIFSSRVRHAATENYVATSSWVRLEGGKAYPFLMHYRTAGDDNTYGKMALRWQNGAGLDGSPHAIPVTALTSLVPADAAAMPDGTTTTDVYGDWTSCRFNGSATRPGVAFLHRTPAATETDVEKLDFLMLSCGEYNSLYADATSDLGHFLYRPIQRRNFELIGTFTAVCSGYQTSYFGGVMVRSSMDANAKFESLLRICGPGDDGSGAFVAHRNRTTAGAGIVSTTLADPTGTEPVFFRIRFEGHILRLYLNDECVRSLDVSDWENFYVGFTGTSRDVNYYAINFVSNATFQYLPVPGTLITLY